MLVPNLDLNAVLKLPGALGSNGDAEGDASNRADALEQAIDRLNHMREEEGRGAVAELRERMAHLFAWTPKSNNCAARS